MKYNPSKIEKKWQAVWEKSKLYNTADHKSGAKNFYALVEFPYPSGNLHTGHWYAFSIPDIFVRHKRMRGYNVMFPIGFDAFGLPAENAAIKRRINPKVWTYGNIRSMRQQLRSMGASFDWSREVITSDPEYYKWTQWLFLQFFKNGLVYRAETVVNWCPKDKTVLANEQVVENCCDRCGARVEQRRMKQWLVKITNYAERLINDLDALDWPMEIKEAQRNWIGRSEGAEIDFGVKEAKEKIKVFTTRPDTLFGATYVVLAPEHQLIENLKSKITNYEAVQTYIEQARRKTEQDRLETAGEKTGVELKGIKAVNPANKEAISVWVADYVLAGYGTGAIMAVPAHDERDFEFARKFKIPIIRVVSGDDNEGKLEEAYVGGGLLVNSGRFDGMDSEKAKWEITKFVGGKKTTQYRLRDWLISRQRYWGTPIPIVYCKKCGVVPVAEKDLPIKLPPLKDFKPADDGRSPLARNKRFLNTKCPKCKGPAERETDTMDTFVDSSWYFLRYTDPKNKKEFASHEKLKQWMPVGLYSGGGEHTTKHLLYARFFEKALHGFGLVKWAEPFIERRSRGLILGPDGQKMSKSRGNVVDPDGYVKDLGADSVRMYLSFIGPYNEVGAYPWDPRGILGVHRFLQRVWSLMQAPKVKNKNEKLNVGEDLERLLHQTIKKVGEDIQGLKFNTAVSTLMIFMNRAEKNSISKKSKDTFLKLLAPFAPHLAEELWHQTGHKKSIHIESWPEYDPELIKEDTFTLVIQVNGKVRDSVEVSSAVTEEEAKEIALKREKVQVYIRGQKPKKVIFVPKRLINFVL